MIKKNKKIKNSGGNIPGGKFLGGGFPGGNFPGGGSLMGGNFAGWSFPDTQNQICSLLHVKLRLVLLTKNMS